jgi:hypothetical protein
MHTFIAYPAATGLATSAAVFGRGLAGSARHLIEGDDTRAGTRALSAPGILAHAATAAMALDVVAGAVDLVSDVLGYSSDSQHDRKAA